MECRWQEVEFFLMKNTYLSADNVEVLLNAGLWQ